MSTNIIAALLGAVIVCVLICFRAWQRKKQEAFRRELLDQYRQEEDR